MNIETWTSNIGGHEVHHFCECDNRTYLFGINVKLLGENFYEEIKKRVEERIGQLQDEHLAEFRRQCEESGVDKQFLKARNKEREPFDD